MHLIKHCLCLCVFKNGYREETVNSDLMKNEESHLYLETLLFYSYVFTFCNFKLVTFFLNSYVFQVLPNCRQTVFF